MSQDIYHLKLVTLGPLSSGKTCLIKRYCEEDFESCYIPTIGVDYGIKYFNTKQGQFALNIFDLSGDNYFKSIYEQYYQNCDILIMTIEALKHNQLKILQGMYDHFENKIKNKKNILKILVVTKTDKSNGRTNYQQIENFAKKNSLKYFETSSQYNENVSDVFEFIIKNFQKRFFNIQN